MSALRSGVGPRDPWLVLVGEAYGEEEEAAGLPFVGAAGRLLDGVLRTVGIPRERLYITNVLNQRPEPGSNEIGRFYASGKPTDAVAPHIARLREELAGIDCPIIVPLGAFASSVLIGRSDIGTIRGYPWQVADGFGPPRIAIPALHPSYFQRGNMAELVLLQWDLLKALRWARGGGAPATADLFLLTDDDEALACLEEARTHPLVALDIETTGLSREVDCFSVCWDERTAFSIAFERSHGPLGLERIRAALRNLLVGGPRILTQNGNYDLSWLERWTRVPGDPSRMDDLMLAHRVVYPDIPMNLRLISSIHTDLPFWKDDNETAKRTGDFALRMRYNATDALATWLDWQVLARKLEASPGLAATYKMRLDCLPYAMHMQRQGMALDHPKWERLKADNRQRLVQAESELAHATESYQNGHKEELAGQIAALESEIAAHVAQWKAENATRKERGEPRERKCVQAAPVRAALAKLKTRARVAASGFNPASAPQRQAMLKSLGVRLPTDRKTGNVTTGKKVLERAGRAHPQVVLLQRVAAIRHEYENFLDFRGDVDGRFRCSFNIAGAESGRFGSSALYGKKEWGGVGMNGQNIPPGLRCMFIADEGCSFVYGDLPGADWVMVAYMSGDARMLEALRLGHDVHAYTASLMTGLSYDFIRQEHAALKDERNADVLARKRKELGFSVLLDKLGDSLPRDGTLRQKRGKQPNHALNYGEGWGVYAEQTGEPVAEAKRQIARYYEIYPGIPRWHRDTAFFVQRHRFVRTCFGEVIPLMGPRSGKGAEQTFKAAYALSGQSPVARLTHLAAIRLHNAGWDLRMNAHDALLLNVPDADVQAAGAAMRAAFDIEMCYDGRTFKLFPDLKAGKNWGEKSEDNPDGLRALKLAPAPVAQ